MGRRYNIKKTERKLNWKPASKSACGEKSRIMNAARLRLTNGLLSRLNKLHACITVSITAARISDNGCPAIPTKSHINSNKKILAKA